MKLTIIILSTLLFINNAFSQTEDEILAEAYLLYNSEKASWNGTDIFLEKFPEKRNLIGGYFSYTENNQHSCVFFDQAENPNLLAKITFNDGFNIEQATLKKEKKKIKSEISLDTMIQIKIDPNEIDTVKENMERGYDEEKKMHFYKVYFNEEK